METGSHWTASATTQSPESLITETLREKPALARPIRRVIFAVRSPAGGICRIRGPVSGRKNPVPGVVMPSEEKCLWSEPESAYSSPRSRCRLHGAGADRLRPAPGFGARNASDIVHIDLTERCSFQCAVICSTFVTVPAISSSSQRRPFAMAMTSRARVSARIGRNPDDLPCETFAQGVANQSLDLGGGDPIDLCCLVRLPLDEC